MLDQLLAALDKATTPLDECGIASKIQNLRSSDDMSDPPLEWQAEALAFAFSERWVGKKKPWGTYFTPVGSGTHEDGTVVYYPSIKSVCNEKLKYWTNRACQTKHPVLQARYAGLVWDFSPNVIGENAPIGMAWVRIDSVVEMAKNQAHVSDVDVFSKLEHVLDLAIRINDLTRVENVRDIIIEFQQLVAVDDKPGLWVPSYDLLYCNKKSRLTHEQRATIIQDLEDRLERLSNPEIIETKVDPWFSKEAALRLAEHYRRTDRRDDLKRVLLKVGRAYDDLIQQADPPMLAQAWLQQLHNLYTQFGLPEEVSELRKQIREAGPGVRDGLVKISETIEIKNDEMNDYVNAVLEGGLQITIMRFIVEFIPKRKEAEKQLGELSKEAPVTFLMPRQLVDDKGRPIATIGSIDDDLDGHVVMLTAQNIQIKSLMLAQVIKEMTSRFELSTDTVLAWIDKSLIFDPSRRLILERGLKAYLDEDPLLSIHLLVPQVENAIRKLVELTAEGDVYKPNLSGGMDLRSMDDLLRDKITRETLSSDQVEYLRALYTDRRGINLRNNLCHGMMPADWFGNGLADRVFHTIIMLSQIRGKKSKSEDPNCTA